MDEYNKKVKWSRYRPGVAQRVGRGVALLSHDRGSRRGWVVSSTLRPHFTPRKASVPILQEAGWVPGPVWKGGNSRPHRDSIPDRPACSSVAIPTELPGPHDNNLRIFKYSTFGTLCLASSRGKRGKIDAKRGFVLSSLQPLSNRTPL